MSETEPRLARAAGLVNGHTHAAMTLFRGYADDLPLMEWLERYIWPAEKRLTDEDVYWGTRLACLEMIRTGTVCFWDMYWEPAATARAVRDAGLRAVIGAPLIDGGDAAGSAKLQEAAERSLEELAAEAAEPGGERIFAGAGAARDLHGQRGVPAVDRRDRRRARAADSDSPLRDRG